MTERQMRNKFYEYAEMFRGAYMRKEWARAKLLYFTAQNVALFLEMSEQELAELFGNRPYKDDREDFVDGLFPEHEVERASWECIKIGHTYDELHARVGRGAKVEAFRDPEWQADAFGGELLVPYHLVKGLSQSEIMEECKVSASAAKLQWRYIKM